MTVEHDVRGHRFLVRQPSGVGELVYRQAGPQLLDLQHTGVAPVLRGHGVAEALVKAAMTYARRNGDKVIATCPFVRGWIDRHPEYGDLVVPAPPRRTQ